MYLKLVETQTSKHFTRNFESEKAAITRFLDFFSVVCPFAVSLQTVKIQQCSGVSYSSLNFSLFQSSFMKITVQV